jgi:hypothetical protein
MRRSCQRKTRFGLGCGAMLVGLLALLAAPPAGAAPGNIRIGTYNTHFITDPTGESDWATNGEKTTAALEIANRINYSDYDVIALNEVFDEDVRSVIHTQTRAEYPYQVVKVMGGTIGPEDSGLMLLSRYPFVANPLQNDRAEWAPAGSIYRNGSTSNMGTYVRFAEFGPCADEDCLAEKGVGVVWIDVPVASTTRRMTFLFTHLQAKGRDVRKQQLQVIQNVFGGIEYFNHFTKDDIFILGDLNIAGEDQSSGSEWSEYFTGGPLSWYDNNSPGFRDSWYTEGFNTDKGTTHTTTRVNHRLDYIIRNSGAKSTPSLNLCNQHMARAYNHQFGPGTATQTAGRFQPAFYPTSIPQGLAGSYNFSDHHGLNMELGLLNNQCSPMSGTAAAALYGDARFGAKDLGAADRNVQINTTVAPGAAAWYRIVGGDGAWAFALARDTAPGSNIEIYEGSDFSRVVRSWKGDFYSQVDSSGVKVYSGRRFLFEKPGTYFVKISLKDRSASGTVRWKHLKLHCGSSAQYCPVAANQAYTSRINMFANKGFPDQTTTVTGTSVHAIDVPPLQSGASQTIVVGAIGAPSTSGMTLMVTDKNSTLLGSTTTKISGDADCRDANGGTDVVCRKLTLTVTGPKRLYVYGIRANIANDEAFKIFWKSPAVVVHGARRTTFDYLDLTAEQTEDGGATSTNDELSVGISLDGVQVINNYAALPLNSEFEDNETYWLDYLWGQFDMDRRFFQNTLHFRFNEEDDVLNGGDDHVNVDFTPAQLIPATGTASFGIFSAANYNYNRVFHLENDTSNSRYRIYLGASRGWGADCFRQEDIGCHQSWQEWDLSLLFP